MKGMKGDPGRCPYIRAKAFLKRWWNQNGGREGTASTRFAWTEAAQQRLDLVPQGYMRDLTRELVEHYAGGRDLTTVDLDVAEAGIAEARDRMGAALALHANLS